MRDVSELSVGEYVLVLPAARNDHRWAAVIVNETMPWGDTHARFTWVHPECLEPLSSRRDYLITVGHTSSRGKREASCEIGDVDVGVRRHNNLLILDARWEEETPLSYSLGCKGYCTTVVDIYCI